MQILWLILMACKADKVDTGAPQNADPYDVTVGPYEVDIRRTAYGVPHVKAEDWGSLGYGLGYAAAQDHGCVIADQVLMVRSERARFLGAGDDDANIDSDLGWLALGVYQQAEGGFFEQPEALQQAEVGYAAGYNAWLDEGTLPDDCAGQDWVRPINHIDLLAYYLSLGEMASGGEWIYEIATGQPPGSRAARPPAPDALHDLRELPMGSNGWALGSERTESGRGALLSNTHFPYQGERQWYEQHLTIPGQLDVYGAGLIGVPLINVGFNEHVAWTHTVSFTPRFTAYFLTLDPDDPTRYLYDGEYRDMTSQDYEIQVLGDDGALQTVSRTLYRSHYGPMLNAPVVGWSDTLAFTIRDANADNIQMAPTWLDMNRATNMSEFQQAQATWQGIPWVHTLAADDQGTAWYVDSASAPDLSPEAVAAWEELVDSNYFVGAFADAGAYLLDGSDPLFEWVEEDGARAPGLVPFDQAPKLTRSDYVVNANDSYWLANPDEPLVGYPRVYGQTGTPRSPRTRMNTKILAQPGAVAGSDAVFSVDEIAAAALEGRGMTAELLRDAVVTRCDGAEPVTVSWQGADTSVDVGPACAALAAWGGTVRLDDPGAPLWREVLGSGEFSWADFTDQGALYAVGFDASDPIDTPNTLGADDDTLLRALATATLRLQSVGLGVDATLRDCQFQARGDQHFALPGGLSFEGAIDIADYSTWGNNTLLPTATQAALVNASTGLTEEGYLVNYGNSYVMAVEFTDDGPQARATLVYSESQDPDSPHFTDQPTLYGEETLRPVLFDEADILADPELQTLHLSHP